MKKTVTIQIGNSDNKLTQVEWSQYVSTVHGAIQNYGVIHFFGGSTTYDAWQNVCIVLETAEHLIEQIKSQMFHIRKEFRQNSVAITIGETDFI